MKTVAGLQYSHFMPLVYSQAGVREVTPGGSWKKNNLLSQIQTIQL